MYGHTDQDLPVVRRNSESALPSGSYHGCHREKGPGEQLYRHAMPLQTNSIRFKDICS